MNKQPPYVPPGLAIHRVILEATIADTTMSVQTFGQIEGWQDDVVIGNDTGEGGDVFVPWI
jgi:hypothetical protein